MDFRPAGWFLLYLAKRSALGVPTNQCFHRRHRRFQHGAHVKVLLHRLIRPVPSVVVAYQLRRAPARPRRTAAVRKMVAHSISEASTPACSHIFHFSFSIRPAGILSGSCWP